MKKQMNENNYSEITNMHFDVSDPRLYSYDFNSFSLVPLQEKTNENLIQRIANIAISNNANFEMITRAISNKKITQQVLNITKEMQEKINSGELHQMKSSTGGLKATLLNNKGKISNQIDVVEVTKNTQEIGNLAQLASMQEQLVELSDKIEDLNSMVERVESGQYNDRIAGFFTARQTVIEAMSASNSELSQQLFIDAIKTSNETISKMMLSVRQDALELANPKTSLKEANRIDALLQNSIGILNASVQLNLVAYSNIHENKMLIASMMNYRSFLKQVLLSENEDTKHSISWLIDNGREGEEQKFGNLMLEISDQIDEIVEETQVKIGGKKNEEIEY